MTQPATSSISAATSVADSSHSTGSLFQRSPAHARVPKTPAAPRHMAIIVDTASLPALAHDPSKALSIVREIVNDSLVAGVGCLSLQFPKTIDNHANLNEALREYFGAEARGFAARGLELHFDYGTDAHAEMARAVAALAREVAAGRLEPASITVELLLQQLPTHELPEVDLVVRTGGETTLSDFMLWQAAYAELLFMQTSWKDFGRQQIKEALADYALRNRTFGALPANT